MTTTKKPTKRPTLTIAQEKKYHYMHDILGISKREVARELGISKTTLEHATAGW